MYAFGRVKDFEEIAEQCRRCNVSLDERNYLRGGNYITLNSWDDRLGYNAVVTLNLVSGSFYGSIRAKGFEPFVFNSLSDKFRNEPWFKMLEDFFYYKGTDDVFLCL